MSFDFGIERGVINIKIFYFIKSPINAGLTFIIAGIALSVMVESVTLLAFQTRLLIFLYELTVIRL